MHKLLKMSLIALASATTITGGVQASDFKKHTMLLSTVNLPLA